MLLESINLNKSFPVESKFLRQTIGSITAVDSVSFNLNKGKILGLVGESGSGKTTLAKIIVGLIKPDSGKIFFQGEEINKSTRKERAKKIQMIFQDPFASLNPRLTIGTIIGEAIKSRQYTADRRQRTKKIEEEIKELLNTVGLSTNIISDYPHQFSGGQRQRIGIARALAMQPEIIIADEPVSSLDVSIQAQILNLLLDLKEKFNLSYIFITHDLGLINFLADYLLVMYRGKIIEEGIPAQVISCPKNKYTEELFNALPKIVF